jgi:hypothetical protein
MQQGAELEGEMNGKLLRGYLKGRGLLVELA